MSQSSTPERGDRPAPPTRPRRPSRTPIASAQGLLGIEPVLVAPGDLLEAVIRRAAASPATRVLGVVDEAGVLVGVVTLQDLVAAIVGRLAPGALLSRIHDVDGVQAFDRIVEARVAADLMRPPVSLRGTATMAEAFRLLREEDVSGVHVVDESGRPTGYLDGLELAASVIGPG